MKADVYSLKGEKMRSITLPSVFESEIDNGLIKRAVISVQTARIQPKGPNPRAGRNYTAEYIGARRKPQRHRTINIEKARLPRMKNRRFITGGNAALVPQVVGGPKAHKLKPETITKEKINRKEKRKAVESAIAATASEKIVRKRGHKFGEGVAIPIVVDNALENLQKTRDVVEVLQKLNLWSDVERAKARKHVRAGKGKRRGRKYKKAKSILIVAGNTEKIFRAARNLEGVDVCGIRNLNVELLAPGCMPGRLTIWTESAITKLGEK